MGVKLTSRHTHTSPPTHAIVAPPSGGWREFELTNNRFSQNHGSKQICWQVWDCRKLESFDHGARLLNSAINTGTGVFRKLRMRSMDVRVLQIYEKYSVGDFFDLFFLSDKCIR